MSVPEKSFWKAKIELTLVDQVFPDIELTFPIGLEEILNYSLYSHPTSDTIILEIYAEEEPKTWTLDQIKTAVVGSLGDQVTGLKFFKILEEDWVEKSLEGLKPIEVGRFFIHGSHDAEKIPEGKTPILIEASLAFGTGHHETTRGCLEILEGLSDKAPGTILDLGTGSGILAIAARNIWPKADITASDNDREALGKTKENIGLNKAGDIKLIEAEGFSHSDFKGKTFNLIIANILAGPLMDLAPEIKTHLKPRGLVILSGLLETQADIVKVVYQNLGFKVLREIQEKEWPTLLLRS